jgi:uncharacterized protein YegL
MEGKIFININNYYNIFIYFCNRSYIQCDSQPISPKISQHLKFYGGGTCFSAGLSEAYRTIDNTLSKNEFPPVLLFLSDGDSSDQDGVKEMKSIYNKFSSSGLAVYSLGFCCNDDQLKNLANIANGKFLKSLNGFELENNFSKIAYEITIGQHK